MFRCQFCHKVAPPRVPCTMIVLETQLIQHPYRNRVNRAIEIDEKGKKKRIYVDDPGGLGTQIAREARACPECAKVQRGE